MLHYLSQITNYLLTQSWQIALIVLVLAALSLALKNKSAHVKYLLWLIVLAKSLVPPLVTLPLAILPQERLAETVMLLPAERPEAINEIVNTAQAEYPISFPTQAPTERTVRFTVRQWLGLGWIIGATMFVLIAVIKAFRTNIWIRQKRRPLPAQMQVKIEELFSNLNIRSFPKIWLIEGIGQPFVWGLLRGSIYLPADFIKVHNNEHRRGILGHELSHILRFDAAVNILQVIAQTIFWFHPFVWWANKKIRTEREKCCDEMAIARLGTEAKEYSTAIVNILISGHDRMRPVPSLAIAGPVKNIEERIKTMLRPGKKFYKRPGIIIVITILLTAALVVPTTLALTTKKSDSPSETIENTNLQINDVKFEPIHQGKNVVHVQVKNNSDKEQTFGIHIQTRSPDYGQHGIGWGRPFFDQIGTRETKWVRCAFQIQGPITDSTWIRLQFYNPISAEDYDFDKWFKKDMYYGKDLKKLEVSDQLVVPASQKDSEATTGTFLQLQTFIRDKRYEQAWQMFTEDYKNAAQVDTLDKFIKNMEEPAYARFYWDKEQFIELKPKDMTAKDGVLSLKATYKEQVWTIDFVREDSQWKVDWISGYIPAIIKNQLAEQQQDSESAADAELEILDVKFEPIRQGKNVVRVKVQNTSAEEQIFRLQIYTRSPDYGRDGVGWGTSFFDSIEPKETKWTRFVFKIQGPITDSTYVRLDFHNPGPAANFDIEKWSNNVNRKPYFKRVKYLSSDLEIYKPDKTPVKPASATQARGVIEAFRNIQEFIRDKKYEQAWKLFTNDYQDAEFQFRANAFERFKKTMEPTNPIDSAFWWEKDDFLGLQPKNVVEQNGIFTLTATSQNQTWTIDFIRENDQWKIDWIVGYTPRVLQWQNWEERLLPKMEKRSTKHFDIYYFKGSTAKREIEQIAEEKEKGFQQICQFLGKDSDVRIRMVLFEDGQTKHSETGHQGMGWAYGNTIVEVYNEKEKLDPYHETTHILMRPFGNPPALFNEGFAVYMSERLGAQALKNLGGGEATIYQRVKELKKNNEWIELEELLTYTEIGSSQTRPPISYAESASFVKFLIEIYGQDKFLQTYKTLRNSDNKSVQQQNIKVLEQIYGQSLKQLEQKWIDTFSKD